MLSSGTKHFGGYGAARDVSARMGMLVIDVKVVLAFADPQWGRSITRVPDRLKSGLVPSNQPTSHSPVRRQKETKPTQLGEPLARSFSPAAQLWQGEQKQQRETKKTSTIQREAGS